MFEEVIHNFGKTDDDMIWWKNAYFNLYEYMVHAQLVQKILDGIYSLLLVCEFNRYWKLNDAGYRLNVNEHKIAPPFKTI